VIAENTHWWTFIANFLPCPLLAHSWSRLYIAYTVKWGRLTYLSVFPLTPLLSECLIAKVHWFRLSLSLLALSALHTSAYGWHFDWFSCALGFWEKSSPHLICQIQPQVVRKVPNALSWKIMVSYSKYWVKFFFFTLIHILSLCWQRITSLGVPSIML